MKKLNFRTLRADEIECRVGNVVEGKGCSLLMYKNARVDMILLDEVVGCENWRRSHELINDNLFCTVSVRFDDGCWVDKQDVGTESNMEKEKGQASDAFKRACFNWGIGRELYTCPFVWVNLNADEWRMGYNGKKAPNVNFTVSEIEYNDNRHVSYLVIKDGKGAVRFVFGASNKENEVRKEALELIAKAVGREELEAIYKRFESLHKDKKFIEACTKQANKIKGTA